MSNSRTLISECRRLLARSNYDGVLLSEPFLSQFGAALYDISGALVGRFHSKAQRQQMLEVFGAMLQVSNRIQEAVVASAKEETFGDYLDSRLRKPVSIRTHPQTLDGHEISLVHDAVLKSYEGNIATVVFYGDRLNQPVEIHISDIVWPKDR